MIEVLVIGSLFSNSSANINVTQSQKSLDESQQVHLQLSYKHKQLIYLFSQQISNNNNKKMVLQVIIFANLLQVLNLDLKNPAV